MRERLSEAKYETEVSAEISHEIREKLKGTRQAACVRVSCCTYVFRDTHALCDGAVQLTVRLPRPHTTTACTTGVHAELKLPRYKFMVQVVIGEQKGEGVRMGCRCFWDSDTDNYASETFTNVSWLEARVRRLCFALLVWPASYPCSLTQRTPTPCIVAADVTGRTFLCGYCVCCILVLSSWRRVVRVTCPWHGDRPGVSATPRSLPANMRAFVNVRVPRTHSVSTLRDVA